jgi:hypothetical protein
MTYPRSYRGATCVCGAPLDHPRFRGQGPPDGIPGLYSRFTMHNKEMEARAPIIDMEEYDGLYEDEYLEKNGPFTTSFLSDTRKVWSVLHSLWSATLAWAHVKMLDKMQNGRQVYHTLYKHFFGGNNVSTLSSNILSMLQGLTYTGDSKNFNFDKTSMLQTMFNSITLPRPSSTMGEWNSTSI